MRPWFPLRHQPFLCPDGHHLARNGKLIGGTVIVGWRPCNCPAAMGTHRGHRTYQCQACEAEHVTMICYLPEHLRG